MNFSFAIIVTFISFLGFSVLVINSAPNKVDDIFKNAPNLKCDNKTDKKVDRLFSLLVPVGSDRRMAENEQELRKYCNLVKQNLPFILGYVKSCVSPFGRTLAKLMIIPVNKQLESICRPGRLSIRARELIKVGQCGNKAKDRLMECSNSYIDAVVGIPRVPLKDRIPTNCCHANALRLCFRDATEETEGCTRHTIDWAEKWALNIYGGAIQVACSDYFDNSDKCEKLIKNTPKSDPKTYVRPKSFLKPMIKLLESFPDIE